MNAVTEGETYAHRILEATARFSDRPALRWKDADSAWREASYRQLREDIFAAAAGLQGIGLQPGDRLAIWLETSRPWILADLGAQLLGGVTATIYAKLPAAQAARILADVAPRALLTTPARLEALRALPDVDLSAFTPILVGSLAGSEAPSFEAFLADGRDVLARDDALRRTLEAPSVGPDDLSAVIYTSGTTGEAKGVMLTHRNVLANVGCILERFVLGEGVPPGGHVTLLYLPLAHVMARNSLLPGMLLHGGLSVIAEPDPKLLPGYFAEVRPTVLVAVPYVLNKLRAKILHRIATSSPLRRWLARLALAVGRRHRADRLPPGGGPVPPPSGSVLLRICDRLVLRTIRQALGGRVRLVLTGAASASADTLSFLWAVGLPTYEGYGATETTNTVTFNWCRDVRIGTVGRAIDGVTLRIADDGEILVRGSVVMRGYWGREDATKAAFTDDGWFRTGDLGALDPGGFLTIRGRKKEILVLSTGKNVAPQAVENACLLSACIQGVCALGDDRRYVTALVVPDLDAIAQHLGLGAAPDLEDPRVPEAVAQALREGADVAGLAGFECVKRFTLLGKPFSIEDGLLTPTLKLRRTHIAEAYADDIEALYQDPQPAAVVSV